MPLAHNGFARRYRGPRSFVESLYRILPGGAPTWHPPHRARITHHPGYPPSPGGKIPAQRVTQGSDIAQGKGRLSGRAAVAMQQHRNQRGKTDQRHGEGSRFWDCRNELQVEAKRERAGTKLLDPRCEYQVAQRP
jgi:hypothetical protein